MNATSSIQVSAQIVGLEMSTERGITVHRYQAPKHHGPNPPPLIHRRYLNATSADPAAYDPASDSSAIVSQPLRHFYIRESTDLMSLNITLCDWGSASWTDNHLTPLIQPVLLRAPEVILGAPWGPSTDIWNFGAILLEILDAVHMFEGRLPKDGSYKTKHHLEEIDALFGPFPRRLLEQGYRTLVARYFNEDGKIRDPVPGLPEAFLEDWVESLSGSDKEEFVSFLKSMMKIDPDERKTARQLLDEAWLEDTSLD